MRALKLATSERSSIIDVIHSLEVSPMTQACGLFNAGAGSALNISGRVRAEASVMTSDEVRSFSSISEVRPQGDQLPSPCQLVHDLMTRKQELNISSFYRYQDDTPLMAQTMKLSKDSQK